jgi:signal recognition particle receptor subunit beta
MALINHRAREINFKIVYVGPGLGGKTTNLQSLHDRLPPERRGRLVSLSTDHDRTLFFDFLPIEIGQVNGFTTRFHLYTVPGQVYYKLSRRAVLQGLDGVVFVADSHPAREQANYESLVDTRGHLDTLGLTPDQLARMPWVFQYNKRDLVAALPVERLRAMLNPTGAPEFEAIARRGQGVSETLRAACKAVLARLSGSPNAARVPAPPYPVVDPVRPAAHSAPTRTAPMSIADEPAAVWSSGAPATTAPPATPPGPEAPARPFMARPRIQTAPRRPWPGSGGGGSRT